MKLQFNRLHSLTRTLSIKMRTFGPCGGVVRTHPVHLPPPHPWLRAWITVLNAEARPKWSLSSAWCGTSLLWDTSGCKFNGFIFLYVSKHATSLRKKANFSGSKFRPGIASRFPLVQISFIYRKTATKTLNYYQRRLWRKETRPEKQENLFGHSLAPGNFPLKFLEQSSGVPFTGSIQLYCCKQQTT